MKKCLEAVQLLDGEDTMIGINWLETNAKNAENIFTQQKNSALVEAKN